MTVVCEPDPTRAVTLVAALGGEARVVRSLPELLAGLSADPEETIAVIGPDAPLTDVSPLAAELRRDRPDVAVLLVRHQIAEGQVAEAIAAGVRQVVYADNLAPLVDAVRGLRAQQSVLVDTVPPVPPVPPTPADAPAPADEEPAPRPPGQVVTVFSPKGGSGKTTISTNLAVALHDGGANRVCLIDLDLEFGDVAISLRLEPVRSLVDAVTADARDDDDAIAMLTTEYRPGLDCILAPIEPGEAAKIGPQLVSDLLYLLRGRYDYIVVDTPSQLSENVLAAVDAADHLVLLANPEIPALKNLRLTLDTLDLLAYRRDARLILFNKQDDAAGLLASEVEEAVGMPLAARVPASRDVPASINKGVPIVAAQPDHPVSVAICDFAQQYIVKGPPRAVKRRRRLFRRRSS